MRLSPADVFGCQVDPRRKSLGLGAFCIEPHFIWKKYLRRCNAIATNIKEDEFRVNTEIKSAEILLIDEKGEKRGIVKIADALQMAEDAALDLVEVAPTAKPPVCRIMNYGKYRFQQQKKDKDARKKQKSHVVKEIKMRPKIDKHDYDFKVKAIRKFLKEGNKVKTSIFFRGREMAFLDRGREVLNKVILEVEELGKVESEPRMEGSYMRIMIAPLPPEVIAKAKSVKAVLAEEASAAETAIKEENTDTNTETEA